MEVDSFILLYTVYVFVLDCLDLDHVFIIYVY